MKFKIDEIVKITNGELLSNKEDSCCSFSISTDSRTIKPEDLYLPLSGANFDGHNFINNALEKGCGGYFVDKNHESNYLNANFIIRVNNTLEAYLQLANYYRKKINPVVVAITGSSGKTTTKEMVFSVLSAQFKTHKSLLNHNNEVGLCQTILSMPIDTEFLVVEMGMRGLGEIELLSKYAQPDIAIITNVGPCHIGRLGSLENIARAKCEITTFLKQDGTLISFGSDLIKETLDWKGNTIFYGSDFNVISTGENGTEFSYKDEVYKLSAAGEYNIVNSNAAIETGFLCGVSLENIKKGLQAYTSIDKRWEVDEFADNVTIINDSYNANPDSVKASVQSLVEIYKNKKKVFVFGDMAELGELEDFYHRELGELIDNKAIDMLVTVGEKSKLTAKSVKKNSIIVKSFDNNDEAINYLVKNIQPESAVLLKASRCMAFENIFNGIRSELKR